MFFKHLFKMLICLFFVNAASAGEVGVYIPGLSYHIGANSTKPAYKDAPRGIDKNGAWVLNPGIGIGYDFRDAQKESSFSMATLAMIFRDCDDRNAYVLGVGPRYRFFVNDKISLDGDLFVSTYSAQDWDTSTYNTSIVPFASIGVNYHWQKISLGLKTAYAPKNKSHTSTSGFNLLFGFLYLGYAL
jgi:hypothetical protein